MEHGRGDGGSAKRPNLSSSGGAAGEDRLSALHDDILVLILLRLGNVADAARTSILSRRWRRTWALLPELTFSAPDSRHIRWVLTASEAPVFREIVVVTGDDAPGSVSAWLPLAARRLSGALKYENSVQGHDEGEDNVTAGTIALPCFVNASEIVLNLGFLALALPSSGVFTRLMELFLERVRLDSTCELGDIVSSPRCPCLRKLHIRDVRGVARLAVHSESLLKMDLWSLSELQELTIDAPVLNNLTLRRCFARNKPVADILAPNLASLSWVVASDPTHVQLGNLRQLQQLGIIGILVYGHHHAQNRKVLNLIQRFQVIQSLNIVVAYAQHGLSNLQYLMEDITTLPDITFLTMYVFSQGHSFGPCSFHLLRLCTAIRRLTMLLHISGNLEANSICPSGCICDQPTNWKIEKLSLSSLQDVRIADLKGTEHEVAFLKRLFNWAPVLRTMRIIFNYSIDKSKVKELCQKVSSISRPETLMEFYRYRDLCRSSVELLSM